MPTTPYTENFEKWQSFADIDYFTYFVAAWIPLNAWYKNYFPSLKTDRDSIDVIKTGNNKIRNRVISLFSMTDPESVAFRSQVGKLHYELERNHIHNKFGERISFDKIVVETTSNNQYEQPVGDVYYKVKLEPSKIQTSISDIETVFSLTQRGGHDLNDLKSRPKFKALPPEIQDKVEACYKKGKDFVDNGISYNIVITSQIKITVTRPRILFSFTQSGDYNFDEVTKQSGFASLPNDQQQYIKHCYERVNPRAPVSLLTNEHNHIEVGNYKFINDKDLICKGLIEILYLLRNALFHGEIVPDKSTRRVYEPAYHILNTLIQAL